MITIEAIPAFNDNYIWCLYDDSSAQAFVVDPGDAGPVNDYLERHSLQLCGILITHHHFDHTGGIETLLNQHHCTVFGPINDNIPLINHHLKEGDCIQILGISFNILQIPGHTLDHIAYFSAQLPNNPVVFCGDTLFAGGCGRIFEGTPAMMMDSLTKLTALPEQTLVYCAHEYTLANLAFALAVEPNNPRLIKRIEDDQYQRKQNNPTVPSMLSLEKVTNPFLRYQQPDVKSAAQQQSPNIAINSDCEVFTTIREWKNNF